MQLWAIILAGFGAIAFLLLLDSWTSLGKAPIEERKKRIETSENFSKGKFRNGLPLKNYLWRSLSEGFKAGEHQKPSEPIQIFNNDGGVYGQPPTSGLRVTWLGHSTVLLELDNANLLIDPIWGTRISPFSWFGPKRWFDPPLAIEDLPRIDAVVISHDHYDHLDRASILELADKVSLFIVPLGVGAHLAYWGISEQKIMELEWWQETEISKVTITATPARHASGRHLFDLDKTLWTGYAFKGTQNVFYSGDTGLFPGFKEIGERLGPFNLTMIEVGAYNRNWPDWHLGPEQAVIAHTWVRGARLLPLHWGLFDLAMHGWTEPMERVLAASEKMNLSILTPLPGQPFEPGFTKTVRWWPQLPWQGPHEHAVISSQLNLLETKELDLIRGQ